MTRQTDHKSTASTQNDNWFASAHSTLPNQQTRNEPSPHGAGVEEMARPTLVMGEIPRQRCIVSKLSDKFIDETIEFWEPRFARQLSREDVGQIIANLSGFFKLLAEWDTAARRAAPQTSRSDIGEPASK